jgi:hypothetical protein
VPLLSLAVCLVTVVGGLAIEMLHVLLVRRRLKRAAWWIPASTASWALGMLAGGTLVTLTGMDRTANREAHTLAGAVAGVVVGATSGGLLSYLRVQSARGASRAAALRDL